MARRGEWTVKFKLFDEWHYDTFEADSPEQAADLFWDQLKEAIDPDTGMVTFKTDAGFSQFRAEAISGIQVQK